VSEQGETGHCFLAIWTARGDGHVEFHKMISGAEAYAARAPSIALSALSKHSGFHRFQQGW
jgi:hypothetical protein